MDESVRAAMAKWPNVPGVHGWLSLDEAGHWRLKGEPITHAGLVEFINRNYACDAEGRWYFQNGPQRGYVELAYTPWVLHVDGGGDLCRHTGEAVPDVTGAWIDEQGNLLLDTDAGIGLVDADALPAVAEWLLDDTARPADAERVERVLENPEAIAAEGLQLEWHARVVPVDFIRRAEVPQRFGFVPTPVPDGA